MRTSDVLNKAADLIEQRGWATGNCGMVATPGAPMCLEGALAAAMGMSTIPAASILGIADGTPIYPYGRMLENSPAYRAMLAHLDRAAELWCWNDSFARGGSAVIEALRACAVIEAARERETAEVSA